MPSWILFALGAPALYAVSNFIDRFLIEKRIRTLIALPVFSGGMAFVAGLIMFVFSGFPTLPLGQGIVLLVAGAVTNLALIPYYKAISLDDPSRVIPIYESRPIFVLVLSYLFLGEALYQNQLWGFLLVLAGGVILSLEKPEGTFRLRKAVGYALFASFVFAIPPILFRYVSLRQEFWASLAYEFIGGGLGAALILAFKEKREVILAESKEMRANLWATLVMNELIYIAGLTSAFYALSLASAPLVTVLGGTQPFFVLLFGLILSVWFPHIVKEDIRVSIVAQKVFAIGLIFAGVWLLQ